MEQLAKLKHLIFITSSTVIVLRQYRKKHRSSNFGQRSITSWVICLVKRLCRFFLLLITWGNLASFSHRLTYQSYFFLFLTLSVTIFLSSLNLLWCWCFALTIAVVIFNFWRFEFFTLCCSLLFQRIIYVQNNLILLLYLFISIVSARNLFADSLTS